MRGPPKKGLKATLQKVFILDAEGGYAGEYLADDNCVVEYDDFLAVVPESGLEDQQTLFLGEYRATALHGRRLSLIAISKGPLGPEELTWAKVALAAAEAHLTEAPRSPEGEDEEAEDPRLLRETLVRREAQLRERERALAEAEERARQSSQDHRQSRQGELQTLAARLADLQSQRDRDRAQQEAERDRLHEEMGRMAKDAKSTPVDATFEAERRQLQEDRKFLQRKAMELHDRENRLLEREAAIEEQAERMEKMQQENEALRAEVATQASGPPPLDLEEARRDIEMRVKILQKKAFDLLDREEKLRKREEDLRRAVSE